MQRKIRLPLQFHFPSPLPLHRTKKTRKQSGKTAHPPCLFVFERHAIAHANTSCHARNLVDWPLPSHLDLAEPVLPGRSVQTNGKRSEILWQLFQLPVILFFDAQINFALFLLIFQEMYVVISASNDLSLNKHFWTSKSVRVGRSNAEHWLGVKNAMSPIFYLINHPGHTRKQDVG